LDRADFYNEIWHFTDITGFLMTPLRQKRPVARLISNFRFTAESRLNLEIAQVRKVPTSDMAKARQRRAAGASN